MYIILLVIVFLVLIFKCNEFLYNKFWGFIALLFTLIGIYLSVFDTVFEQNENYFTPIKQLYTEKSTLDYQDILTAPKDTIYPHLIFIVDKSASMKSNTKFDVSQYNFYYNELRQSWLGPLIGDNIEKIKLSNTEKNNQNVSNGKIVQLWLLNTLKELKDYKGSFSLLTFGDNVSMKTEERFRNNNDIHELANKIVEFGFSDKNTDFDNLFEAIKSTFQDNIYNYNPTEKNDYTFIFLSDFIHDVDVRKNSSNEDKKKIKYNLENFFVYLKDKNVFVNFFVVKSQSTIKENQIAVDEYFNKLENKHCNIINLLEGNNFKECCVFSSVRSKQFFPFYYINHLYEDSLQTVLTFQKLPEKKKIRIRFFAHQNYRQFFTYIKNDENSKILCENPVDIEELTKKDSLLFNMQGHIPHQYPFAEIVFENLSDKTVYDVEIIFLKQLPEYLKYVIPVLVCLFLSFCVGSLIYLSKSKKNACVLTH